MARLIDPESGAVSLGDYQLRGGMSRDDLIDPRGTFAQGREVRTEFGFVAWHPSFEGIELRQVVLTFSNPDYVDEVPADAAMALAISHALRSNLGEPQAKKSAASPFDRFWFGGRRPKGLAELEAMSWRFDWGKVELTFDPRDLSPRVVVEWSRDANRA